MSGRRTFADVTAAERERCAAHAELWARRHRARRQAVGDEGESFLATRFEAFAQELRGGLHVDGEG